MPCKKELMEKKTGYIAKRLAPKKVLKFVAQADCQLLDFLYEKMSDKSKTTVKAFLAHKQVVVDTKVTTKFDFPLKKGTSVTINTGKIEKVEETFGMRILHEDEDIIIIDKDPGLLTMGNEKEKIRTAYSILSAHVKKQHPKNLIFIVHRLDRETSGVMIFAKSEKVQSLLQKDWNETIQQRTYIAIVEGVVARNEGKIVSWLKENKHFEVYSSPKKDDGQEAITNFKLLKIFKSNTLLELNLETGRKNQIRVHMKDIGHPVVGDKKYGAKSNPIGRICLHAKYIEFDHPTKGKRMKFEAPLPKKMSIFLNKDRDHRR